MPIKRHMVPGMREPVSHFCHVVQAGDTIAIYITATNSNIAGQGILFGSGPDPASTAVSVFDANINVLGGIDAWAALIDRNIRRY